MKNKTVMDAVKYWNGDKFVCGKHEKHHTHIVNAVGTDRFYSAYASDIGGDSAVCTISEYNQLIHSCSTNSEESSIKHLHIWQEGLKQVNKIDWSKAPKDAEYYQPNDSDCYEAWYKNVNPNDYCIKIDGGKWQWCNYSSDALANCTLISRPKSQPVFTQAMADKSELPQVGMECIGTSSRGLVMTGWEKGSIIFSSPSYTIFKTSNNIEFCCNHLMGQDFKYKPIDTRTDKEKAIDEILCVMGCKGVDSNSQYYKMAHSIYSAGYVHGVKRVGE